MVPRATLAVALLLALVTGLCAQMPDSLFVPARIPDQPIQKLPRGWAGEPLAIVGLSVEVLPDSAIGAITVTVSVSRLDSLAVRAVRGWRAIPATLRGVPVPDTLDVAVAFQQPVARPVNADSLRAARMELRTSLETWHTAFVQRELDSQHALPPDVIAENYHLLRLPNTTATVFRDGYTERMGRLDAVQTLQDWRPLYDLQAANGALYFSQQPYTLSPAYTSAHLGLGDYEMNHAVVDFRKGDLLGVNGLQGRFAYCAYEGAWLGANEKAGDSFVSLQDSLRWGAISGQYARLSHTLAASRWRGDYEPATPATTTLEEYRLGWRLWNMQAGVRTQRRADEGSATTWRLYNAPYLGGLSPSVQLEITDHEYLWTAAWNDGWKRLHWRLLLQDSNDIKPEQRHTLGLNLGHGLAIGADYTDLPTLPRDDIDRGERYTGAYGQFSAGAITLTLRGGRNELTQSDAENRQHRLYWQGEAEGALNFAAGSFDFGLRACCLFAQPDTLWYKPQAMFRTEPEICLRLPYGNSIAVGGAMLWVKAFAVPGDLYADDTTALDAWLRIGITNRFAIRVEAHNLTNALTMLGEYVEPTHVGITARWTFVN